MTDQDKKSTQEPEDSEAEIRTGDSCRAKGCVEGREDHHRDREGGAGSGDAARDFAADDTHRG